MAPPSLVELAIHEARLGLEASENGGGKNAVKRSLGALTQAVKRLGEGRNGNNAAVSALLVERGAVYLRVGNVPFAERDLGQAADLDPTNWRAHSGLADLLAADGRLQESLAPYARAAALNPFCPRIACSRGYAHSRLGEDEEALAAFDAAIRASPACAQAFAGQAALHFQRGRDAEAYVLCQQAANLNPCLEIVTLLGTIKRRLAARGYLVDAIPL